jgi:nitroimidazol reductase NimA-like FMN-containing flavoprotein (pyridoxamine 5'-phosphate oxidase superfamily)
MTDSTVNAAATPAIEVLSEDECRSLLASSAFGRLAVVDEGQPIVLPVNYAYTDDGIVIHTNPGVKLDAGAQRRVAFEIDEIDADRRTGWSVLVKGHAFDATETIDDRSERLRNVPLESWGPGEKARRLMITISEVSGRRISRSFEDEPSP